MIKGISVALCAAVAVLGIATAEARAQVAPNCLNYAPNGSNYDGPCRWNGRGWVPAPGAHTPQAPAYGYGSPTYVTPVQYPYYTGGYAPPMYYNQQRGYQQQGPRICWHNRQWLFCNR